MNGYQLEGSQMELKNHNPAELKHVTAPDHHIFNQANATDVNGDIHPQFSIEMDG